MANLHKPRWQDVEQEAPDELDRFQRHKAEPVLESRHWKVPRPFLHRDQTTPGDCPRSVLAGEVFQNRLLSAKGRFGVDDPLRLLRLLEPRIESGRLGEMGRLSESFATGT